MSEPIVGRTYKWYKGGTFKVLHLAKDRNTKQDQIVFQDISSKEVWICSLNEWRGRGTRNDGTKDDPRWSEAERFKSEDTTS